MEAFNAEKHTAYILGTDQKTLGRRLSPVNRFIVFEVPQPLDYKGEAS